MSELNRREFLQTALLGGAGAALPAQVVGGASPGSVPAQPVATSLYQSLGPAEAAFVEAMVNMLCPADNLTPNGVDCGLAVFIDRQLAGGFGKGERLYLNGPWRHGAPEFGYQLPFTPEEFFKAGLAAADEICHRRHGRGFAELGPADADTFLREISDGGFPDARVHLGEWFNDLVYPLFVQACFADPVYGGNRDKVFWSMLGYPGLPAMHAADMERFRGRPYPGRATPKSMADYRKDKGAGD